VVVWLLKFYLTLATGNRLQSWRHMFSFPKVSVLLPEHGRFLGFTFRPTGGHTGMARRCILARRNLLGHAHWIGVSMKFSDSPA
jgi:hypothetical protein